MTVLVVYASRREPLRASLSGLPGGWLTRSPLSSMRCVDQVETFDDYDAVVFGAPVYDQLWPPEATAPDRHFAGALRGTLYISPRG